MKLLKQTIRRLQLEYLLFWLLAVVLFLLYETGLFEEGVLAVDVRMRYLLQSVGILLTLAFIPLALKLFGMALKKRIAVLPVEEALKAHLRWSEVRLALLTVVVLVNLSVYYWTLSSIGGLCALLGLLASLFCWPSAGRIKDELNL